MGYDPQPIPELQHADLREYLPAVRHAEWLLRREEERCRRRVEPQEFAVVRQAREELAGLRHLIVDGEN